MDPLSALDCLKQQILSIDDERKTWINEKAALTKEIGILKTRAESAEKARDEIAKRARLMEYALKRVRKKMEHIRIQHDKLPAFNLMDPTGKFIPPNPKTTHKFYSLPSNFPTAFYKKALESCSPGRKILRAYLFKLAGLAKLKRRGKASDSPKSGGSRSGGSRGGVEHRALRSIFPEESDKDESPESSPSSTLVPTATKLVQQLSVERKAQMSIEATRKRAHSTDIRNIFDLSEKPDEASTAPKKEATLRFPRSSITPPGSISAPYIATTDDPGQTPTTRFSAKAMRAAGLGGGGIGARRIPGLDGDQAGGGGRILGDEAAKSSAGREISSAPDLQPFQPRISLRNHLDGVRSVAFHSELPILMSGSDDGTAKYWNLDDVLHYKSTGVRGRPYEPVAPLRGHRGPVTAVAMQCERALGVTASTDGTVVVWSLPDVAEDSYASYGSARKLRQMSFEAHSDAVWDICLHPASKALFSAGSDGRVCAWNIVDSDGTAPVPTVYSFGGGEIPTTVKVQRSDMSRLVVGYTSGAVVQFDIETAKPVAVMTDKEQHPSDWQVNRVVTHPTETLAFSACSDKRLRIYDLHDGTCVGSMRAHTDSVSALCLLPDGHHLVSASHDSSVRFWDFEARKICADIPAHQTHRRKHDEGIHCIVHHPTLPLLATAGADSVIRIYNQKVIL
eukprot:903249_1